MASVEIFAELRTNRQELQIIIDRSDERYTAQGNQQQQKRRHGMFWSFGLARLPEIGSTGCRCCNSI